MLNVFITGIAGTLGSNLTRLLLDKGFNVKGNDIQRIDGAWKLRGVEGYEYLWKSTIDLDKKDLIDVDVVFDCGLEFADRPLGISSPMHTVLGNLLPPMRLLEIARKMKNKPIMVYPSSFNSLYGHSPGSIYIEETNVNPTNQYGWSKASAELLYTSYQKGFGIPIVISRVGSAYGARMRSDELVMKLIINCSKSASWVMRSPYASRLWTYAEDVGSFYEALIENLDDCVGKTLHCAGNYGDRVVTNIELSEIVARVIGREWKVEKGEYEAGELVDGKPVSFSIDGSYTRNLLNWKPKYTIREGLEETVKWYNSEAPY